MMQEALNKVVPATKPGPGVPRAGGTPVVFLCRGFHQLG